MAPGEPVHVGITVDADRAPGAGATTGTVQANVAGHSLELVPVAVHCKASAPDEIAPPSAALTNLVGLGAGGCSSACLYAESILFDLRTTMIASGCTSAAVVNQGFVTVFRIAWDDDDQAVLVADYARSTVRAQRAVVLREATDYGRSIATAFSGRFRDKGGSAQEIGIPSSGTLDVDQTATQVRAAKADVILLALTRPDAAQVLARLQGALPEVPIVATDTVLGGDSGTVRGLVATGLARRNGTWVTELELGPDSTSLFSGQDADAVLLYAAALQHVAKARPDGSLVIDRQRLKDAIARQDLLGRTGRIDFDARGERRHDVGAALYRLDGARAVLLRRYER